LCVTTAEAVAAQVSPNFEPASVSFVSASDGFVLGNTPCAHTPCTALLVTTDGGKKWSPVAAPRVALWSGCGGACAPSQPPSDVTTVVFANASDGWVFGPSLWATTNGGHFVSRLPLEGLTSGVVAASSGHLFAVATTATGAEAPSATSILYCSTDGGRTWSTKAFDDKGATFLDLQFATTSFGAVVEGHVGMGPLNHVLLSRDGGDSWSVAHF
jgi:photosystem II stability/assembly factor-like uncharacterized protein